MRDEAGLAGDKAAVRWGLGGGWHGMMLGAARGPVAGPACRACIASASEEGGSHRGVDAAAARAYAYCKDCLTV